MLLLSSLFFLFQARLGLLVVFAALYSIKEGALNPSLSHHHHHTLQTPISIIPAHILNLGFKCRKIGFSPVWSAPISLDHSSTICHLCIHFGDRIVGVELHPVQIQRDFRLSPKLSNSIFPSFFLVAHGTKM